MTNIFASEAKMQEWLSDALKDVDGLGDLISNIETISEAVASHASDERLLESFKTCIKSLYITHTMSENENISVDGQDILKPDFLLYAPETESIVIVELKNLQQTTRQAGTEISAYACEVRSSVPFIADGDMVSVIVSPFWPALLKHHVRQEILWQGKNVICLRPVKTDNGVRLEILDPSELRDDAVELRVPPEYLGGYQICLYDDELYSQTPDKTRLDKHVEQFKTALNAMASTGARLNSHGFAFLWRDNWKLSLAPYSITTMNFAPFQSVERFLHVEDGSLPRLFDQLHTVIREYSPGGHGEALSTISHSADPFLQAICSPRYEGFMHWGQHRPVLIDRAELVAFVAWGRFQQLYYDRLGQECKAGNTLVSSTDPHIGLEIVDQVIDNTYEFVDLAYIGMSEEDEP